MDRYILQGEIPIEIALRRSARARRLTLRVSQLDGRVTLTMPTYAQSADVAAFLEKQGGWLRTQLGRLGAAQAVGDGCEIMLRGVACQIVAADVKRVRVGDTELTINARKPAAPQVRAALTGLARDALSAASDRYAAALGVQYQSLTLRDPRSRWGSCTAQGRLMYSWRLIMAPPAVLDYVAAHEVAHLVEMNHKPAFWSVVDRIYPGYATPRAWLKTNGATLHRYRFKD